jgi:NAD(P)-dependent dehydrogenase (short-subunit alcohol dehydrogenase family)
MRTIIATDERPQRVLITGASSGLGQACAVAFCADGAEVIGMDRSPGDATAAAAGPRFRGVIADLGDAAQIERAFEQVDQFWQGRSPDLFVACASISRAGHFLDMPLADIDAQLAVNVRGMILCGQQVGRRMKAAGGGRIVHITSVAASTAWATEPVYGVTKGAQASLTQGHGDRTGAVQHPGQCHCARAAGGEQHVDGGHASGSRGAASRPRAHADGPFRARRGHRARGAFPGPRRRG